MPAEDGSLENSVLDEAVAVLRTRLPGSWTLTVGGGPGPEPGLFIQSPAGLTSFLVQSFDRLRPAEVRTWFGGSLTRQLRAAARHAPLLVVAPTLTPQTRTALKEEGVAFIDVTGNVWLSLDNPSVLLDIEVPRPAQERSRSEGMRGLSGAAARRVMRTLVDGRPPCTLNVLARASGVSLGYCSRVAASLADEELIERTARAGVESADWEAIIRMLAALGPLFRPHLTTQWVARRGVDDCLKRLEQGIRASQWCVTGSHAAARFSEVASPRGLTVWLPPADVERTAEDLDLLPVDSGGDVRLLRAENLTAFDRIGDDEGNYWDRPLNAPYQGVRWAAPSQAAIDCLAGTGRMPEEGEALLGWMVEEQGMWRFPPVSALPQPASGEREAP